MPSSSKLRSLQTGGDDDLKVDMSPMIDMVFLLLIFFLVNATMIIVKQDANVMPPVADKSKPATDGNGRIVINIYSDGRFFSEDEQELVEDDDFLDLITKQKEQVDLLGYEPKLHLRGDEAADFKYCRKVIRLAAKVGVDKVLFATYAKARK